MIRGKIWRSVRVAALAAVTCLAFGSIAWGQDWGRYDNDSYYRGHEARERGYHRGYDDGFRKGQYDADRGHHFKFRNDDWEDSRGFEHWMGDKHDYKNAYRDGYERGYRAAYNNGYRWRDRDDLR